MDVSLWSSSVYILNAANDARIHSSLKRKDFVNWPTYISVFRCKDLWSFVDAYCLICFPAQKTVRHLYSLFSRDAMYISKCKIAEPLSFQLSLVIEQPKYISFLKVFSILKFGSFTPQDIKMAERTCHVCLKKITHSVNFSNLNC